MLAINEKNKFLGEFLTQTVLVIVSKKLKKGEKTALVSVELQIISLSDSVRVNLKDQKEPCVIY